jgi:tryptophan-rich sensory protein
MSKKNWWLLSSLLVYSFIGLIFMLTFLPTPSTTSVYVKIVFYIVDYLLIASGPISALLVLKSYIGAFELLIIVLVGSFSLGLIIYLFKKKNSPDWAIIIPTFIWCSIGTYSTFWGTTAGV